MHHEILTFDSQEDFNKALNSLEENKVEYRISRALEAFCVSQAEYKLAIQYDDTILVDEHGNEVEVNDDLINELAKVIYESEWLINFEGITEEVGSWFNAKGYEFADKNAILRDISAKRYLQMYEKNNNITIEDEDMRAEIVEEVSQAIYYKEKLSYYKEKFDCNYMEEIIKNIVKSELEGM